MNSDFEYAETHFPGFWRILNVRLLAWKAGHKLILHARRSPFFDANGDIQIKDLLFALWVCSRDYKHAKHFAARGIAAFWHMGFIWPIRAFFLGLKLARDPKRFDSATEAFFRYMLEGEQGPKGVAPVSQFDANGDEIETKIDTSSAPALMVLKCKLMRRYSEDEFFEMPMLKAIAENAAQCREDGSLEWPTDLSRFPKIKNEPDQPEVTP